MQNYSAAETIEHIKIVQEYSEEYIRKVAQTLNVEVESISEYFVLSDSSEEYELYISISAKGSPDAMAFFIRDYCRQKLNNKIKEMYELKVHVNEKLPKSFRVCMDLDLLKEKGDEL